MLYTMTLSYRSFLQCTVMNVDNKLSFVLGKMSGLAPSGRRMTFIAVAVILCAGYFGPTAFAHPRYVTQIHLD